MATHMCSDVVEDEIAVLLLEALGYVEPTSEQLYVASLIACSSVVNLSNELHQRREREK